MIINTVKITHSNNIIIIVSEHNRVSSLIGKLAALINLISGADFLYLVILRTDIIVYSISTSPLNNFKFELITYNKGLVIIEESRWLIPATINNKSFLLVDVTIIGPRAYKNSTRI